MQINLIADSSVASAPAGFTAAVQAAANVYESDFSGNYTVNITYGWGTYDNAPDSDLTNTASGVFSVGGFTWDETVSYSALKSLLTSHETSSNQITAFNSLPASTGAFPDGANTFALSPAQAKALDYYSGSSPVDGSIGFNIGDASLSSDWEPAALTELAHALGWTTLDPNTYGVAAVADLFRYSSLGQYQWTDWQKAYFSIDGGKTDLGNFDVSGFDDTLFPNIATNDPLRLPFTSAAQTLTSLDITALSAIGFSPAVHTTPTLTPTPITAYSSTASGYNHFIDLSNFEASFRDLISAFGANQSAMQNWYNTYEPSEQRIETFDGLDYVASYRDLIGAYRSAGSLKAVQDDGAQHYITSGLAEGRTTTFNGLDYIASYPDLIKGYGANNDAGAYHYIEYGVNEGRTITFDALDYIASYSDLIKAYGVDANAGADHYIEHGYSEGRTTTFDGLDYIASYSDLIKGYGANNDAGATHYIEHGYNEGRRTTFDGLDYIANYPDLMKAFGANNDAGAAHYIAHGYYEGRTTTFNVAAYESAHPDLVGKYNSNDAFLTAYIDHYQSTGKYLT